MKISCVVEVINRLLPSLVLNSPGGQKSTLSVITNGNTTNYSVVLLHQTNDNISGTIYKVLNNIETIFLRFINEGKATIRLKSPQVDLAIKAGPLELKCFIGTLVFLFRNNSPVSKSPLLNETLPPADYNTKVVVTNVPDFATGRYHTTVTTLQINRLCLKTIDTGILGLTGLQILNISNNEINCLPKELGRMSLKELHVADNRLGCTQNWNWICHDEIQNSLQLLDLANNQLKCLPVEIGRFKKLVSLKLCNNEIVRLPPGIGKLETLKDLSIAQNQIEWLPSTFRLLRLLRLDISGNSFISSKTQSYYDFNSTSLKQLAAAVVIDSKLALSPETLPQTVLSYLDCFTICQCGYPTLIKTPFMVIEFKGHRISSSVTWDAARGINSTMGLQFCQPQCVAQLMRALSR